MTSVNLDLARRGFPRTHAPDRERQQAAADDVFERVGARYEKLDARLSRGRRGAVLRDRN